MKLSVLSSKGIITFHGHAFLLPVREEVLYGKEFSQREVLPTQVVINDFGITTVLNQGNLTGAVVGSSFFFKSYKLSNGSDVTIVWLSFRAVTIWK